LSICGEHQVSRLTTPGLICPADARLIGCAGLGCPARLICPSDARLIGCAGLRCPARLICPADARPIGCAGLRCPARLICPADARLIGCAGLRCPARLICPADARLISCAGLGCTARLIGCAWLRYPAGLIRPLSLQRATPVQSKRHAQGCHREREGFESFFERHCSLLSLNRHSQIPYILTEPKKDYLPLQDLTRVNRELAHGCAISRHPLRSRTGGKPVAFYSDKHGVRKNRSTLAIHSPGRI
jgi:hypothetical protein